MDVSEINHWLESKPTNDLNSKFLNYLLNSSNSFELLLELYNIVDSQFTQTTIVNRILEILKTLNFELHKMVCEFINHIPFEYTENLLRILEKNIEKFINQIMLTKSKSLLNRQIVMLALALIHIRGDFMTNVFHLLMNQHHETIQITNYDRISVNNRIRKLMNILNAFNRVKMRNSIEDTLAYPIEKTTEYWANLDYFIKMNEYKIDFEKLLLMIKTINISDIFIIYYMMNIVGKLIVANKIAKWQYNAVCEMMMKIYFDLVENIKFDSNIYLIQVECILLLQTNIDNLPNFAQNPINICYFNNLAKKVNLFGKYSINKEKTEEILLLKETLPGQNIDSKIYKMNRILAISLINKLIKHEMLFIECFLHSILEDSGCFYNVSLVVKIN